MTTTFVRGAVALAALTLALTVASAGAPLPPPAFPAVPTPSSDDAADRYANLIEHFQPASARDASGPNAWSMLVAAAAKMREVDERTWRGAGAGYPDFARIYAPRADRGDDDDRNLALSHKLLHEYRAAGVFDALAPIAAAPRAARARPGSPEMSRALKELGTPGADEPWNGRLVSLMVPELGPTRALVRANTARMSMAAGSRSTPEFLAAFEQSLALARVAAQQPGALDRAVASAAAALAAEQATRAVRGGLVDRAVLDGLNAALDRQTRWPSLRLPIEGERLLALDICRWAFDNDGKPDPTLFHPDALARADRLSEWISGGGQVRQDRAPARAGSAITFADREQTVIALNRAFDLLAGVQSGSRASRDRVNAELSGYLAGLPEGCVLPRMIVPGVVNLLESDARTRARLAVLRVTIALERHKAANAGYPESLEPLTHSVDVNDPWTDRPLRYAKTPDGYTLSSAEADELPVTR